MNISSERPLVYLITKGEASSANFLRSRREIIDIIRVAVDEHVDLIQIREKQLSARSVFELASASADLTRGTATRLLINDRADIAIAAGADGVHLTAGSLATKVIRGSFPSNLIVGVSAHTSQDVMTAQTEGADFVVYGPVYETPDKDKSAGVEVFSEMCESVRPFPVLALGGIDKDNYRQVIDAGASGFAAIRALNDIISLRSICRGVKNEY